MRLFLGIEIPAEVKDHIAFYLRSLKKDEKGWEDPHDYHLTLLFIGPIDPALYLDEIKKRMHEISFTSFEIFLGPLVFFNRRVLYVSFFPSEKLLQLKTVIEKKYPEYVRLEAKEFVPHLTVKRWQRYEYDDLKRRIEAAPFESIKLVINGLALFKAEKDSANKKYHVIYRTAFKD